MIFLSVQGVNNYFNKADSKKLSFRKLIEFMESVDKSAVNSQKNCIFLWNASSDLLVFA